MQTQTDTIEHFATQDYKFGFITEVEQDTFPPGLSEEVIRMISAKKEEPEWMLEWRLKAYCHWLTMEEPTWANIHYSPIDYQSIAYYSAPKPKGSGPKSLDEVDPEILKTYEKLGIPLHERELLAGVAVDAVFDSVSVATTFKAKLGEMGIIFCSFSEAVQNHPELVKQYLGSVVPYTDNFFATLNSAVFSDGSFVYMPKGVRCPMELSTYFRINARNTGQFERTLIIADEGAYVSYLEGCTAPMRDENQLHAAVVELVALEGRHDQIFDGAELVSGRRERQGRHLQLRDQARQVRRREREDLLDAGGDGLGHHLEVSERDPQGRQLGGRVLLGGSHQGLSAGRHRHQDDPHREEHQEQHRLEGHLGRPRAEHVPRPSQDPEGCGQCPQLLAVRLDADRRSVRGPHVPVHRRAESDWRGWSTRPRRRRSARIRSSTATSGGSPPRTPCR